MTKSKTEPALQVAGAIQNVMTILAKRVADLGGDLTKALVLIGTGEARCENGLNMIAAELAWVSTRPSFVREELAASPGVCESKNAGLLLKGPFLSE